MHPTSVLLCSVLIKCQVHAVYHALAALLTAATSNTQCVTGVLICTWWPACVQIKWSMRAPYLCAIEFSADILPNQLWSKPSRESVGYHSSSHIVFVARVTTTQNCKAAKNSVAIPPMEGVTWIGSGTVADKVFSSTSREGTVKVLIIIVLYN